MTIDDVVAMVAERARALTDCPEAVGQLCAAIRAELAAFGPGEVEWAAVVPTGGWVDGYGWGHALRVTLRPAGAAVPRAYETHFAFEGPHRMRRRARVARS
jgi:hypothetical protein